MTVRKRIRIALILMLVIPAATMIGAVGMTRHFMGENIAREFPERGPPPLHFRGRPEIMAVMALLCLLGLTNGFLSWWVASAVLDPLKRLKEASNRIGDGDLEFIPDLRGACDEFRDLGGAFGTMQEKLKASLELQAREEGTRRELIAHVSHDLRTPISVIRGYAEGLRDGVAATAEDRAAYVETILANAERLETLIESFFTFSRLDIEGLDTTFKPLDLLALLRSLAEQLGNESVRFILADGFSVKSEASPGIVVSGDRFLLERLFRNLVENSVKHSGQLPVEISLSAGTAGGGAKILFRDNGSGFPPDKLESVFKPFFRADESRHSSGSGLGLSIVRKIMEAHGGEARALLSDSGGLAIELSFPAAGAAHE